jgi:hypothetical protein
LIHRGSFLKVFLLEPSGPAKIKKRSKNGLSFY